MLEALQGRLADARGKPVSLAPNQHPTCQQSFMKRYFPFEIVTMREQKISEYRTVSPLSFCFIWI
jgi:hypothetical protein